MFGLTKKTVPAIVQPWKTRMIQWIGEVCTKNGFLTPHNFADPLALNGGDRILCDMIGPLHWFAAAAEAVRTKDKDSYQKRLKFAIDDIIELIKDSDTAFALYDEKQVLPGRVALDGKLVLVVTELSEMSFAARSNDIEAYNHEHADVEIRMNHIAYGLGTDVQQAVEDKMEFNAQRPPKHGKHTNL